MSTATRSSTDIIDLFKQYVIANYTRYPVCLVRGEGSHVWDAEGNRYLDLFPGWGCDILGHCPPRVVEAVREQVGQLIHVPNTWYTEPQGLLARALSERSGIDGRSFFCNSGAEAVEAAIKLARLHGKPGRYKILSMINSFHGRTPAPSAPPGSRSTIKDSSRCWPASATLRSATSARRQSSSTTKPAPSCWNPFRARAASTFLRPAISKDCASWPTSIS